MRIAIIGAGPAGLFAAEILATANHRVTIYDRMPTPARKFLLAGRGGLNLTHSEPVERFITRYAGAAPTLTPALQAFPPKALQAWCENLGQPIFTGTSGRIFPTAMKAAPLLRAWLRRLAGLGVTFHGHHRWLGWTADDHLSFATPTGHFTINPDATLLALGGASWPRMGSDGAWVPILRGRGVQIADLRPSNCGVTIPWSAHFTTRFQGHPLKRIALSAGGQTVRGDAIITSAGLEGGPVYALSATLRSELGRAGEGTLHIDLRPDLTQQHLATRTDGPRQARSLSNLLRQQASLAPAAIGLIQEHLHSGASTQRLSTLIKSLPLTVTGLQPIARAISSAGGIALDQIDDSFMLKSLPGIFAAGEMLDWEAPTGGYLLQACFSTAALAARGIIGYLDQVEAKEAVLF